MKEQKIGTLRPISWFNVCKTWFH